MAMWYNKNCIGKKLVYIAKKLVWLLENLLKLELMAEGYAGFLMQHKIYLLWQKPFTGPARLSLSNLR